MYLKITVTLACFNDKAAKVLRELFDFIHCDMSLVQDLCSEKNVYGLILWALSMFLYFVFIMLSILN